MVSSTDLLLLLLGVLLLLGILATKLSPHLGVPALVLFMATGMLAGPEGPGNIVFRDAKLAQFMGTVSLIGILFSSGMGARWDTVGAVLRPGVWLGVLGPVIATTVVAIVAHLTAGVSWASGALLGAVVGSTDPVALGSLFRSRRARTDRRTMELLRFESAVGAAMSAFLAIVILSWALGQRTDWFKIVLAFLSSAMLGAGIGFFLGQFTVWVLNHLKPDAEVLYTLLTVAAAFILYGMTSLLHGSGFLGVFVGAVVIGNSDLPDRGPMRRFHEGLPWLSQITLFVLIGLLVPPSAFTKALGTGVLVTAALVFMARPLATLLALPGSRLTAAQKTFVSWVGLKGSVPVALATFAYSNDLDSASWILGVVAVVVVLSAFVHGISVPWLAGVLRLRAAAHEGPEPLDMVDLGSGAVACFRIEDRSPAVGRAIHEIDLPENCLIVMITRDGERVRPRGTTVLSEGDEVYCYSPPELFPVLEIRLVGERDAG